MLTNPMTDELLFFPDLILGPLVRGLVAVGIVGHGVSPLADVQLVAWRQLYKNRSSRKIDSQVLFSSK